MTIYASVLPGRIRLRHPDLRNASRRQVLAQQLSALARVDGNPAAGSLLLTFDPAVEAQVRVVVDAAFPPVSAVPVSPSRRAVRPGFGQRDVNRVAKAGAVVSMAVSLLALGTSRRLHAQAGMVFLVMMLIHMAVHWRRTFK